MRPMSRVVLALPAVIALAGAACTGADSISSSQAAPPEAFSVSISPKRDTLQVAATRQLTARVFDASNQTRDHAVTWRSVDPGVATVSSLGLVTAVAPGSARITAAAGGLPDTANIVVLTPASTLTISPNAMSVIEGDSVRLTAASTGTAGASIVNSLVRWTSSDPAVAQVSESGVVTTTDSGSATITAQRDGMVATAQVQVQKGTVSSLTLSPATVSVFPRATLQMVATARDANGRVVSSAGLSLKWSSSNRAVASVSDDGLVTAVAKGVAIITAQSQSRKATASVNVLDVPSATVDVALAASSLAVGQTTQAVATVKDSAGNVLTGRVVAWQSSNPALATVNSSGVVTALAKSSVNISAISDAKVGTAALTITAPVPTSIAIAPAGLSVVTGQSGQLTASERDADGNVIPNRTVTWSSDNPTIVSVSSAGLVTGLRIGAASVHAAADGLDATVSVSVTAVPAASVQISPTTISATVGDTARLGATVRDGSGAVLADRAVAWTSSNPTVATVSATGLVTAVSAGTANIVATADGVSVTAAATVSPLPPPPVATVSVSLSSTSLTVGQSTQAVATLRDAAGNTLTGRSVTWSSANPELATVNANGQVTAVAPGSASIVATSEGRTGAASVTIAAPPPAPVATVSLTAGSTSLIVGQTMQIAVTLKDAGGNVLSGRTITWTSSSPAILGVTPTGLVTALGAGTATVTATSEGKSGSMTLTIAMPPVVVASVVVALSATSLNVGQTAQATATVKDGSGAVVSGQAVTWSSSAPALASVTGAGVVTALGAGSVNITATAGGKSGSAALTVAATTSPTPPSGGGACSLVTDWNPRPTTPMGRPGYLQPVREPDFGTTIVRVSGDPGAAVPNVGGTWGNLSGNAYAKEPAWNADMSLLVLRVMSGGTPGWLYLDGNTYQPVFRRTSIPGTQELWHPTMPDVMVFSDANGSVGYWNVRTQAISYRYQTSGVYTGATLGAGEGNVSADGRWVVVLAKRASDGHQVAYAVDLESGAKGGDIDMPAFGVSDADWASISELGGYIVIHGVVDGVGQRVKAWSRTTLQQTGYWPTHPMGHFDLGVTPAGREAAFGGDAGTLNPTQMVTLDLGSGGFTSVSRATTWDWHASTRNTKRPGWGVVGTNNSTAFALSGEIWAVKMDGSQQVERYAHHRSVITDYETAPFASPSWDGKRIIFRSNWGDGSGRPVGAYVIDTRSICP